MKAEKIIIESEDTSRFLTFPCSFYGDSITLRYLAKEILRRVKEESREKVNVAVSGYFPLLAQPVDWTD